MTKIPALDQGLGDRGKSHVDHQQLASIQKLCGQHEPAQEIARQVLEVILSRLGPGSCACVRVDSSASGAVGWEVRLEADPDRRAGPAAALHLSLQRGAEIFGELTVQPGASGSRTSDDELFYTLAAAMLVDTLYQRRAADVLSEELQRYRDIALCSGDWVWEVDRHGRYTFANDKVYDVIGYHPEEILGRTPFDLMPEAQVTELRSSFQDAVAGRKPLVDIEIWNIHKDGSLVCLLTRGVPILNQLGELTGYRGVDRDITQRRLAERKLRESERQLRQAQSYAHLGYWRLEADMGTAFWSDEVYKIIGREPSLIAGPKILQQIIHPDDYASTIASLRRAMREGTEHTAQYRIVRPDGELRWLDCKGLPMFDEGGKVTGLYGIFQDITKHKLQEDRIRRSLQEKEILLREIHHRAKNNLQVVSGLLSLQAMNSVSSAAAAVLRESVRRIKLMADIHTRLYQSSNLAEIRLDLFVKSLADDMLSSYGLDAGRIDLKMELQPVELSVEQAIPCCQIVSELVSNAMEHAFPAGRGGTITITLSSCAEGMTLEVWDNGVGMPPGLDWRESEGLGLQLIAALLTQLDGRMEPLGIAGTGYRILL